MQLFLRTYNSIRVRILIKILPGLLLLASACFGQLNIDNTLSPEELLRTVLLGDGLEISNVEFHGKASQFALFENRNSALGFQNGVLITTGRSIVASTETDWPSGAGGSVNNRSETFDHNLNGIGGDEDLNQITGGVTVDAASIEFDFIPSSDFLEFNYVFASEEYPEFNCAPFSDIFAFLIEGPGYTTKTNIALLPDSNIPVSINSINNGIANRDFEDWESNCGSPNGSLSHSDLYINNIGGNWIEFDGMTTTLTASAIVVPCETYRIKIVIADAFDASFDSGVFLEAKSFDSQTFKIESAISSDLTNAIEGCAVATIDVIFSKVLSENKMLDFRISGSAVEGIDFENIPDAIIIPAGDSIASFNITPITDTDIEGIESVIIEVKDGPCNQYDTLIVEINDPAIIDVPQDSFAICSGQRSIIPLEAVFVSGDTSGVFEWNPYTGIENPVERSTETSIDIPINYTVRFDQGLCSQTDSVVIYEGVANNNLRFSCSNVTHSGFAIEYPNDPLIKEFGIKLNNQPEVIYPFGDPIVFNEFEPGSGEVVNIEVVVYYKDDTSCGHGTSYNISCQLLSCSDYNIEIIRDGDVCDTAPVRLQTNAEFVSHEWKSGTTTSMAPLFNLNNSGLVQLKVEDEFGCKYSTETNIHIFDNLPHSFVIDNPSCSGNDDASIEMILTGRTNNVNISWSNNAIESIISNLTSGSYYVTITDVNDCTIVDSVYIAEPEPVELELDILEPICFGDSDGTIDIIPLQGSLPFKLILNGNAVNGMTANSIMSQEYTLTVTDDRGCQLDTSFIVNQPAPFIINLDEQMDLDYLDNASIEVSASNPQGSVQYNWQGPILNNLSCTDCSTPSFIAKYSEIISVEAIDDAGCTDNGTVTVNVTTNRVLNIPTAFTPNGDGNNDWVSAFGTPGSLIKEFNIYDRSGGHLTSTENIEITNSNENLWDGTYKGEPVAQGIYLWTATVKFIDQAEQSFTGSITLLR